MKTPLMSVVGEPRNLMEVRRRVEDRANGTLEATFSLSRRDQRSKEKGMIDGEMEC